MQRAVEARAMIPRLRAGDLLVWDSRLLHSSYAGVTDEDVRRRGDGLDDPDRTVAGTTPVSRPRSSAHAAHKDESRTTATIRPDLLRAAPLVTFTPRAKATAVTLRKRRRAIQSGKGVTTTHWPHEFTVVPSAMWGKRMLARYKHADGPGPGVLDGAQMVNAGFEPGSRAVEFAQRRAERTRKKRGSGGTVLPSGAQRRL